MLIYILLSLIQASKIVTEKEFELYDGNNPEYMLAARDETLFFITSKDSRIQKANTVFKISKGALKMGFKSICSDGMSGIVLRLCEYSNVYPDWKLIQQPNEYEMYQIRTADGKRCAIYGPLENEERRITIGSCQDTITIKFKLMEFDEYLTKSYDEKMADGVKFWPSTKMSGWPETRELNGHYNPLIPERLTLNV